MSGRVFDAQDTPGSMRTVVINKHMADIFWPGQSPLGRRITTRTSPKISPCGESSTARLVARFQHRWPKGGRCCLFVGGDRERSVALPLGDAVKRIVTFKSAFWSAFVLLLVPAFLLERHLENVGLVDVMGSWYTLWVAMVGSGVVACVAALILVRVLAAPQLHR